MVVSDPPSIVDGASAGPVPPADTAVDAVGPRIPRRIEWLTLPAPYDALRLRVWTNFPHRVFQQLETPASGVVLEQALRTVVLEHNGWLGDDGTPLPDAQSEDFWWGPEVSAELLSVVRVWLTTDVPFVLPRSMTLAARRFARTAP